MKKIYMITILLSIIISGQANKVGINVDNPTAMLDILSKNSTSATKALTVSNATPTETLTLLDNGNMGINAPEPLAQLDIDPGVNTKVGLKLKTISSSNLRQNTSVNYNNFARLVVDASGHVSSQYDFRMINSNAITFDGDYTTNGSTNTTLCTINSGSIVRFVAHSGFSQGRAAVGVVKYADITWSKEAGFRVATYGYDFANPYSGDVNGLTITGIGTNTLAFHVLNGDDLTFQITGGNLVYREVDSALGTSTRKEGFRILKSIRTR